MSPAGPPADPVETLTLASASAPVSVATLMTMSAPVAVKQLCWLSAAPELVILYGSSSSVPKALPAREGVLRSSRLQIGRAPREERVGKYWEISVVDA